GASRETTLLRWQPGATRQPAAGSRTQYRLPVRWQASSSPTAGTLATRRVPGQPTQSIASAAGPRARHKQLRAGRRIGRSSASLSLPGSTTHRVTELESALRHRLQYVPSRCLEWARLAFEIWFVRPATRIHPHSSLAPKDYRRSLSESLPRRDPEVRCLARRRLSHPGPGGTVPLRIRTTGCRHPLKRRRHPARMFPALGEISALRTDRARVRNRPPPNRFPCQ